MLDLRRPRRRGGGSHVGEIAAAVSRQRSRDGGVGRDEVRFFFNQTANAWVTWRMYDGRAGVRRAGGRTTDGRAGVRRTGGRRDIYGTERAMTILPLYV